MITGKVQLFEATPTKNVEVGSAFARETKDSKWVDLNGKNLKKVEAKLKEKIGKKD